MTSIPLPAPQRPRPVSRRAVVMAGGLTVAGAAAYARWPVGFPSAPTTDGERLADAARRQLGQTTHYDPAYVRLAYPGGDVDRETGVCADVIVRAARDGLDLDLQALVHKDMGRAFDAYPARWGLKRPDANIDHRRVPNLEVFWRRAGAELWQASGTPSRFPRRLQAGDILTWRSWRNRPHVGLVYRGGFFPLVIHNIGMGAMRVPLWSLRYLTPHGHYRWPA